jgi:hypothetical protein
MTGSIPAEEKAFPCGKKMRGARSAELAAHPLLSGGKRVPIWREADDISEDCLAASSRLRWKAPQKGA